MRPARPARRSTEFAIQPLESRCLLSATLDYAGKFANNGNFNINSVASDEAANVYITGTFAGTADFDLQGGTRNLDAANGPAFVAMYDPNGKLLWAKQFGTSGGATPGAIAVDPFGGILVVGTYAGSADLDTDSASTFTHAASGNRDIFVIKLYPDGTQRWVNTASTPADENLVGAQVDNAGNVYLAANLVQSGLQSRGYVARFNGKGNGKILGTFGDGSVALNFSAITSTRRGVVFLAGNVAGAGVDLNPDPSPFFGVADLGAPATFLLNLSGNGEYQWADALAPTGITISSLAADIHSNLYAVGSYTGTADFNPSRRKAFNLTSAGGTDTDAFLAHYNPNGSLAFAKSMGGTTDDTADAVALDPDTNDVVLTGTFTGKAYFNPGISRFRFYSLGGVDAFSARFDSALNFLDGSQFGGTADEAAPHLAAGGDGSVFLAGPLSGSESLDADPDFGTHMLANSNSADTDGYLISLFA